jgi:hypothetical protein
VGDARVPAGGAVATPPDVPGVVGVDAAVAACAAAETTASRAMMTDVGRMENLM